MQGRPCEAGLFSNPFKEAKEELISDFHARYIKNALSNIWR